jgi:hypothetical protein
VKHLGDSSLRYRWVQNDIISLKCVSPVEVGTMFVNAVLAIALIF